MDVRKTFLRPVKAAAIKLVYRDRPVYDFRFRGRTTRYSTEGPEAKFFFHGGLAFGRVLERPITNAIVDDLERSTCFADVGANVGYYSSLARNFMAAGGQVYSFEMDAANHEVLQRNLDLNESGVAATAVHAAVGSEPGSVTYTRSTTGSNPILSLYQIDMPTVDAPEEVTVPVITLDEQFAEIGVVPDLMKIDVEGAELDVLRGMTASLPKVRRIYLEVHPRKLAVAGHNPAEVLSLLEAHFDLKVIPGHRTQQSTVSWVPITAATEMGTNTIVLATNRAEAG